MTKADNLFNELKAAVNADLVSKTKAVFHWRITKDGKVESEYVVDLKNGNGSVSTGAPTGKADCTLTLSEDTILGLASGELQAMKAFMSGALKVSGNVMLAQKLEGLFKSHKAKL